MLITIEAIIALAAIVESIINILSGIYLPMEPNTPAVPWTKRINWKLGASVLVGVLVSFAFKADLTAAIEIPITSGWEWLGFIMTGILIARGSNLVHDLLTIIKTKKAEAQAYLANYNNVD